MSDRRSWDPVRGAGASVNRVQFSCCCDGLQGGAAVLPPSVSELLQRSRHHRGESGESGLVCLFSFTSRFTLFHFLSNNFSEIMFIIWFCLVYLEYDSYQSNLILQSFSIDALCVYCEHCDLE